MRGVRVAVMVAVYHLAVALMWTGHVIVQLAGAVDAYTAALLGRPRLAYTARRFAAVMRDTWKDSR